MGSGLPIAAVVGRTEVMDAAAPGSIGGTYIGSPVCCAAALATIKLMEDLDLNSRAMVIADQINSRFKTLQLHYKNIGDVRGLGAMIGIEFVDSENPAKADADLCKEIVERCTENGLIVISAGMEKNVIRILSPLVITDTQLAKGLDILEAAIINAIKKNL
jgi:4-aminobutyrate aminotransferase/(S)-3-amino-2-methylpropionate transaminase